jgi:hypothetical protein
LRFQATRDTKRFVVIVDFHSVRPPARIPKTSADVETAVRELRQTSRPSLAGLMPARVSRKTSEVRAFDGLRAGRTSLPSLQGPASTPRTPRAER